jgi:hypothetical protein
MSRLDALEKKDNYELQARLEAWERADRKFNGPEWTPEERQECTKLMQDKPDFVPTVVELARFGSVSSLLTRYKAILSELESEGLISHEEIVQSAAMAVSGEISIGGIIQEGKTLKAWLNQHREAQFVHSSIEKAFHLDPKEATA